MARLSVIVVSYQSRAYLPACLDSIGAQLGEHDELIVVDNGSTDGGAALVREQYPWARLLEGTNIGYAAGNNRGAAVARGELLVFLNPDTVLRPGALDALAAPFAGDATIGLTTACVVHLRRPEVVNACGNTVHYTGLAYCRGAGRPRAEFDSSCEVDAVSGAAFAMRRALFEQLGGFDERFFMYVEDTDLSLRARLVGSRCWYAADALVLHDYRPSYTPAKAFYLERNRHMMLLKNLSRRAYRRLLPALVVSELVSGGFMLLHGPRYWSVKPRVYGWLWRNRRAYTAAQRPDRRREQQVWRAMTHRLEFGQLANRWLSTIATALFHPTFWMLRPR
jgi:GT2 family glycosyltransferase